MKRLTRLAAIAIIAILTASMAMAQETAPKNDRESVRTTIYLSGGMQYIKAKAVNNELTGVGYSKFSDINYLTGFGIDVTIYNRWIIGAEWDKNNNTATAVNSNLSMRAQMSGSRTMIRFGYNVVHRDKFNFFPEIGIGGNLIKFNTKSFYPDYIASNFSQIFTTNDGNMATYTNSFVNIGVGFDFTISDSEYSRSGCRIGIRAGYQGVLSHSWSNNSSNIEGPRINPNMFYMKLTIGFTTEFKHKSNTLDTSGDQ